MSGKKRVQKKVKIKQEFSQKSDKNAQPFWFRKKTKKTHSKQMVNREESKQKKVKRLNGKENEFEWKGE